MFNYHLTDESISIRIKLHNWISINIKAVGVDAAQRTPDGRNPVVTSV